MHHCLAGSTEHLIFVQVCAAGALLAILQREDLLGVAAGSSSGPGAGGQVGMDVDAQFQMYVERLAEVSLNGQLIVDPASMRALQIFQVRPLLLYSSLFLVL